MTKVRAQNGLNCRVAGVPLAAVLVALLIPSGCVSDDATKGSAPGRPEARTSEPMDMGNSLSGNYLAGRHAQVDHDAMAAARYLKAALALDPENTNLKTRAFMVLASAGEIDEATALAEDIVQSSEKATIPNVALSLRDMAGGKFAEASERLAGLPDKGFGAFLVPLVHAWALAGKGDEAGALKTLKPLSARKGFEIFGLVHSALISDFVGSTQAAHSAYKAALNKQKEASYRFVTMYGGFLERTGDREGASILYGDYLKHNPGVNGIQEILARFETGTVPEKTMKSAADGAAEALFDLASALGNQRAGNTALILSRFAISLRPDFYEAKILAAEILEDLERYEQAIRLYETIERDTRFWSAVQMRIANNLDDLDRTDEAAAKFRAMADAFLEDADPLIELGRLYHRHERYDEAVATYDEAFARVGTLQPHNWRLLYSRGMSLERAKNWPRAEADFLKALEFRPNQPFILNYLGYSWVDQGLHLERGQEMIKKAVKLRPTDGYIVDSLGWIYFRLGDFENAVKELERAVQLRPQDPVINDHLGDAYWRIGRRQEARFQWSRALSFDPPEENKVETKRKLKEGMKPLDPADGDKDAGAK